MNVGPELPAKLSELCRPATPQFRHGTCCRPGHAVACLNSDRPSADVVTSSIVAQALLQRRRRYFLRDLHFHLFRSKVQ